MVGRAWPILIPLKQYWLVSGYKSISSYVNIAAAKYSCSRLYTHLERLCNDDNCMPSGRKTNTKPASCVW